MYFDEAKTVQGIVAGMPVDFEAFYARISTYDPNEAKGVIRERIDYCKERNDELLLDYLIHEKEKSFVGFSRDRSRELFLFHHETLNKRFKGVDYMDPYPGAFFLTNGVSEDKNQPINCLGIVGVEMVQGFRDGFIYKLHSNGYHSRIDVGAYPPDEVIFQKHDGVIVVPSSEPIILTSDYKNFLSQIFASRGNDQLRLDNLDFALNDFVLSAKFGPNKALPHIYYGVTQFHLGEEEIASEFIRKAYNVEREIVKGLLKRQDFSEEERVFINRSLGASPDFKDY